jgi:putative membrane protein insertion efficiency factor
MTPVSWLLTTLITLYQRLISPALAPRCRYYPTCSSYAREAILRHGALKGGGLALWRLLRCNPWGDYGYDPVPEARCPRHAHHALPLRDAKGGMTKESL